MALELFRHEKKSVAGRVNVESHRCKQMTSRNDRVWDRGVDRRTGLSQLLVQAVTSLERSNGFGRSRAELETALRRALNARSVVIREGSPRFEADTLRVDRGALRVALPGTRNPAMHLEVAVDRERAVDAWGRQRLLDAARIAALALKGGLSRETADSERAPTAPEGAVQLIGSSASMTRLKQEISRMARTTFTVLVEGESGCGKELVARRIHDESDRRHGRFIGVNCAALVETLLEAELFGIEDRTATGVRGRRGKFELADGGTLFLDEVSDLSSAAQAKLLRAIQEMSVERVGGHTTRPVDIRLIVATNRSLRQLVTQGTFRADLYYRLGGLEVVVPPLRARRGDIVPLATHFLDRHRAIRHGRLSDTVVDALVAYDWPGNVRELERVIERAVAMTTSTEITLEDLPSSVSGRYEEVLGPSLHHGDTMRAWGSRYARIVLDRCNHNKRQACRALGISYHTLQAYLSYAGPKRKEGVDAPHSVATLGRGGEGP